MPSVAYFIEGQISLFALVGRQQTDGDSQRGQINIHNRKSFPQGPEQLFDGQIVARMNIAHCRDRERARRQFQRLNNSSSNTITTQPSPNAGLARKAPISKLAFPGYDAYGLFPSPRALIRPHEFEPGRRWSTSLESTLNAEESSHTPLVPEPVQYPPPSFDERVTRTGRQMSTFVLEKVVEQPHQLPGSREVSAESGASVKKEPAFDDPTVTFALGGPVAGMNPQLTYSVPRMQLTIASLQVREYWRGPAERFEFCYLCGRPTLATIHRNLLISCGDSSSDLLRAEQNHELPEVMLKQRSPRRGDKR